MKKVLSILLFILLMCNMSIAQEDTKKDQIIASFFKTLEERSSYEAIDNLFEKNKTVIVQKKVLENIKARFNTMTDDAGTLRGYEKVSEEIVAPSLVKRIYIAKYDAKPVYMEFTFYKPGEEWQVAEFKPMRAFYGTTSRGN